MPTGPRGRRRPPSSIRGAPRTRVAPAVRSGTPRGAQRHRRRRIHPACSSRAARSSWGRHAECRGGVLDVKVPAFEQLLGNQRCARIATRIDVVERAGQPPRDVGRVGTHHHHEDELRIPRWAIGQVVGKQETLARARGDDAPAIGDRLHIHRPLVGARREMLAPSKARGRWPSEASVRIRVSSNRPLQRTTRRFVARTAQAATELARMRGTPAPTTGRTDWERRKADEFRSVKRRPTHLHPRMR